MKKPESVQLKRRQNISKNRAEPWKEKFCEKGPQGFSKKSGKDQGVSLRPFFRLATSKPREKGKKAKKKRPTKHKCVSMKQIHDGGQKSPFPGSRKGEKDPRIWTKGKNEKIPQESNSKQDRSCPGVGT